MSENWTPPWKLIMGWAVGNLSYIVPRPGLTFLPKWIEVATALLYVKASGKLVAVE